MAIARDTFTDSQSSTSSPLTFSHTCTGVDLVLWVTIVKNSGDLVTGVTYNGVTMTQASKFETDGSRFIYLYYLINPATGSNTISVSFSDSSNCRGQAVSYTGCDQTTQPDAVATNSATSTTSLSQNLTSTVDGDWGICIGRSTGGEVTGLTNLTALGALDSYRTLDSNGDLGTSGTETLAFQGGASGDVFGIFALIKAKEESSTNSAFLMFM